MCRLRLGYLFMATAACPDYDAILLAIRVNRISTIRIRHSDVCRPDRAYLYEHPSNYTTRRIVTQSVIGYNL